jgi:hypothetical protein
MFQRAARLPEFIEVQRRLGLVKEAPLDERLKTALMSLRPKPDPAVSEPVA